MLISRPRKVFIRIHAAALDIPAGQRHNLLQPHCGPNAQRMSAVHHSQNIAFGGPFKHPNRVGTAGLINAPLYCVLQPSGENTVSTLGSRISQKRLARMQGILTPVIIFQGCFGDRRRQPDHTDRISVCLEQHGRRCRFTAARQLRILQQHLHIRRAFARLAPLAAHRRRGRRR